MFRLFAGGLALALLLGSVAADDKKDPKDKPAVVSWERSANGVDLKLDFDKDALIVNASNGGGSVTATCTKTVDKDGVVKIEVTKVVKKGMFPDPPKEFSFKWKIVGDTATLSDLKGEGLDDVKDTIEGEYKKKK
jgi:hypothetical protein